MKSKAAVCIMELKKKLYSTSSLEEREEILNKLTELCSFSEEEKSQSELEEIGEDILIILSSLKSQFPFPKRVEFSEETVPGKLSEFSELDDTKEIEFTEVEDIQRWVKATEKIKSKLDSITSFHKELINEAFKAIDNYWIDELNVGKSVDDPISKKDIKRITAGFGSNFGEKLLDEMKPILEVLETVKGLLRSWEIYKEKLDRPLALAAFLAMIWGAFSTGVIYPLSSLVFERILVDRTIVLFSPLAIYTVLLLVLTVSAIRTYSVGEKDKS